MQLRAIKQILGEEVEKRQIFDSKETRAVLPFVIECGELDLERVKNGFKKMTRGDKKNQLNHWKLIRTLIEEKNLTSFEWANKNGTHVLDMDTIDKIIAKYS